MAAGEASMDSEKLVKIIEDLLETGDDLDFLKKLRREDLEKLVASIRDRVDRSGNA
jgi:hypothetical protein